MIKEKLIEELQKLPDGAEVCIFDWKQNAHYATGDPSSEGIHSKFEVEYIDDDASRPFIAITFDNYVDYDEDFNKIK